MVNICNFSSYSAAIVDRRPFIHNVLPLNGVRFQFSLFFLLIASSPFRFHLIFSNNKQSKFEKMKKNVFCARQLH